MSNSAPSSAGEPAFAAISALATQLCGMPVELHALIDAGECHRLVQGLAPAEREAVTLLATIATRLVEAKRELFQHSTALVAAQESLLHLAQHDGLTGLVNRARLTEVLTETVARSRRHGTGCAVLYLDIDHFKRINDGRGHDAGDAVLREFARRLRECARETDTVARLGGDEFVIVLEDLHDADGAIMVAGKIREAMRAPFEFDGASIDVSTSIGIAYGSLGESRLDNLLTRADRALYRVKAGGRGDFLLADAEDDDA